MVYEHDSDISGVVGGEQGEKGTWPMPTGWKGRVEGGKEETVVRMQRDPNKVDNVWIPNTIRVDVMSSQSSRTFSFFFFLQRALASIDRQLGTRGGGTWLVNRMKHAERTALLRTALANLEGRF